MRLGVAILVVSVLAQKIVIDPRKLIAYALDLNSVKGRNKAIMFQQHLSFTPENY
jgi:hypothetical protein